MGLEGQTVYSHREYHFKRVLINFTPKEIFTVSKRPHAFSDLIAQFIKASKQKKKKEKQTSKSCWYSEQRPFGEVKTEIDLC